ncbi:hypothetical protein SAM19_04987 [Brevibacillus laterosporus]|nr:hypothetical protein [Brevibacillus laterosporus]
MNKNWNELSVEEKKWLFEWNKRNVRKEGIKNWMLSM